MKEPEPSIAARCILLRTQSKRGIRLHPDDQKFVEKIWKKYNEWYRATEKDVFEAAKPFGYV